MNPVSSARSLKLTVPAVILHQGKKKAMIYKCLNRDKLQENNMKWSVFHCCCQCAQAVSSAYIEYLYH